MAKYLDQTGLTYFWGKVKGWVNNSQHPVGSIYISTSASFNPQEAWGGTWKKTADGRCLIGANDTYPLGSTGGEAAHTLTTDEMPKHTHAQRALVYGYDGWDPFTVESYTVAFEFQSGPYKGAAFTTRAANPNMNTDTDFKGSGYAHNNMQPYLAVYIWERTA